MSNDKRFDILIVYNDDREEVIHDVVDYGLLTNWKMCYYQKANHGYKNSVLMRDIKYFDKIDDYEDYKARRLMQAN